jgi:hypothetical protein
MKKFLSIIVAIMFVGCMFTGMAIASDKILDAKVVSATTSLDKNGSEYVRILISEDRQIQGVKYTQTVAVMAFGNMVKKAKALKGGDTLKAICSEREYRGRTSYTVLAFTK